MKICVFCSSNNHVPEKFRLAAAQLGEFLAENGHTLIYGGATGGLMDEIAKAVFENRGEIIGVIPEIIKQSGRLSQYPTKLIETANMNERKKVMKNEADAFVVLPGGYGTMDEMFDVVSSAIVGEHRKPLFCLNLDGFYDSLLKQIERMKEESCIPQNETYAPVFVCSLGECFEMINNL